MFYTNYTPLFQLITHPRLSSFKSIFKPTTDAELYGIYLWSQHVAASQYPLLQTFEICLRNTIDIAARTQFGDFWWDKIQCHATDITKTKFYENIEAGKIKLKTKYPTHDQIIAATDLSTWQFILNNDFWEYTGSKKFLWPAMLGKAFKNYSKLHQNPKKVKTLLISLIYEIRVYRNRIFHHETMWTKNHINSSPTVVVDYIREKINDIVMMISYLDQDMAKSLNDSGILLNIKRICTLEELKIYSLDKYTTLPNIDSNIKSILIKNITDTSTLAITDNDKMYCAYRKR